MKLSRANKTIVPKKENIERRWWVVDAEGGVRAVIFPHQGSGVLTSVAWAQGLVEIRESTPVQRGDAVPYYSFGDLIG